MQPNQDYKGLQPFYNQNYPIQEENETRFLPIAPFIGGALVGYLAGGNRPQAYTFVPNYYYTQPMYPYNPYNPYNQYPNYNYPYRPGFNQGIRY